MRQVIKDCKIENVMDVKNVNAKYIYAGLDEHNEIHIVTRIEYASNYYRMQRFSIGEDFRAGFTTGAGHDLGGECILSELITKFIEMGEKNPHKLKVFEFQTLKEFLEWALSIVDGE